jgi:hypothetical protein
MVNVRNTVHMARTVWPSYVEQWGSTAAERTAPFPCDGVLTDPECTLYRAVDVEAPVATTFRWLCQLRAAPYSYDKLDNLGKRSPQTLTPGLDAVAIGQRWQTIFKLVGFETGRSLTMVSKGRVFGHVVVTYRAEPAGEGRSRIVVKLLIDFPRGLLRPLARLVLPPGDVVMMRRQLLNLKGLAERTAGGGAAV